MFFCILRLRPPLQRTMSSVALGGVTLLLFVVYVCCKGGFEGREIYLHLWWVWVGFFEFMTFYVIRNAPWHHNFRLESQRILEWVNIEWHYPVFLDSCCVVCVIKKSHCRYCAMPTCTYVVVVPLSHANYCMECYEYGLQVLRTTLNTSISNHNLASPASKQKAVCVTSISTLDVMETLVLYIEKNVFPEVSLKKNSNSSYS